MKKKQILISPINKQEGGNNKNTQQKHIFEHYKGFTVNGLAIMIIFFLCFVLAYCLSIIITQCNLVFDDSFITYRYAKNLAYGYGITWNPNEQPVEGYTNLLLLLVLAPFIKLGLSPLFVTRVLSFMAVLGMFLLLYRVSKKIIKPTVILPCLFPRLFYDTPKPSLYAWLGLKLSSTQQFCFLHLFLDADI